MGQKIYWFTGQPGAGKTTLSNGLMNRLSLVNFIHIDGDDIRDIFQNKDYSENGRRQNIQRAQDIAQFLNAKGNNVIVSLVSPYKDQRDNFKKNPNVVEIYVHTDEIRGREQFHVQNYEPPTENFIEINTTNTTVDECVEKIIKYVG
jgi:adenylylsulfate kinase-like enzyme